MRTHEFRVLCAGRFAMKTKLVTIKAEFGVEISESACIPVYTPVFPTAPVWLVRRELTRILKFTNEFSSILITYFEVH